jgi:hypothetical protein
MSKQRDKRDKKGTVAQEPRRDQLDDQGRQHHMGHGDRREDEGWRRPLEEGDQDEGLGRPVRIDREERPASREPRGQWEDRTEGTSRQAGPLK